MKTQADCLSIYVLFCFLLINTTSAQSAHSWRGLNRNSIYPETYPETGLLKTWPLDGPELLWETLDIGKRYFCPINVMF